MHTGHERRSPKDRDGGDSRYGAMDHYFTGTNGRYDDNEAYHREQRSSNNFTSNPQSRKSRQRDSHFAAVLPDRAYTREVEDHSDPSPSEDEGVMPSEYIDDSRFSRDYQFTIASLDEEMHGKAVALFDFTRENENELPLVEGQVILVSYRQQQGWLVAEDPRTGESGLVPEEYVRLLRDIEGGYASLSGMSAEDMDEQNRVAEGEQEEEESSPEEAPAHLQGQQNPMSPTETQDPTSPASASSPTITTNGASSSSSAHHPPHHHHTSSSTTTTNTTSSSMTSTSTLDRRPAAVSSFSTSSSDLNPFPSHLLTGSKNSETPPPVTHYGSQSNTPTVGSPPGGGLGLGKWDGRKDSGNGGGEGDGGEGSGAGAGEGGGEGVVTLGKGAFGQGAEVRRSR